MRGEKESIKKIPGKWCIEPREETTFLALPIGREGVCRARDTIHIPQPAVYIQVMFPRAVLCICKISRSREYRMRHAGLAAKYFRKNTPRSTRRRHKIDREKVLRAGIYKIPFERAFSGRSRLSFFHLAILLRSVVPRRARECTTRGEPAAFSFRCSLINLQWNYTRPCAANRFIRTHVTHLLPCCIIATHVCAEAAAEAILCAT